MGTWPWSGRPAIIAPILLIGAAALAMSAGARGAVPCAIRDAIGVGSAALDYRPRGNRCEGLFSRQVATPLHMELIGFQRGRAPRADLRGDGMLRVRVLRRAGDTTLRATGTRPRLNYGMDTAELAPDGSFAWDTRIVAAPAVALSAGELALVACSNRCLDGARTAYMPVEFEVPPSDRSGRYTLVVRSLRDLDSLRYELLRDGRPVLRRALDGPLAAERAIPVALGELPGGTYTVRMTGLAADGMRGPLDAVLLVPDAS